MDATAHRLLKQARDTLVDGFGLYRIEQPPPTQSLSADQGKTIVAIANDLMYLMGEDPAPPECQECATPLIQPATGRPRQFCSNACRQAWHRHQ